MTPFVNTVRAFPGGWEPGKAASDAPRPAATVPVGDTGVFRAGAYPPTALRRAPCKRTRAESRAGHRGARLVGIARWGLSAAAGFPAVGISVTRCRQGVGLGRHQRGVGPRAQARAATSRAKATMMTATRT